MKTWLVELKARVVVKAKDEKRAIDEAWYELWDSADGSNLPTKMEARVVEKKRPRPV